VARVSATVAIALGLLASALSPASAQLLPGPSRAVLIVIDGCGADYLGLCPTPNLDALAARGVRYSDAIVGHVVNDTPAGHATLVTGRLPSCHGVVAHEWHDVVTGDWVHLTGLEAAWDNTLLHAYDGVDVKPLSSLVKQRYPDGYVAAVSCGKFYAAALMGAPDADEYLSFPPDARREDGPPGEAWDWTYLDTTAITAAIKVVRDHRPALLMINMPEMDRVGQERGGLLAPDVMAAVLSNADRQIGRLVDEYRAQGLLGETVFVVTADHGMVPSRHIIDPAPIKQIIESLGTKSLPDHQHIWLSDSSKARYVAEEILRRGLDRLIAVYYRPDGNPGAPYELVAGPPIGAELDAAYRWLLSTYQGPHGPDVVLALHEDTVMSQNLRDTQFGLHTGFTWRAQHIPLIIAGPGVRAGVVSDYPARLVDVAPTLSRLLDLGPAPYDGAVLADALADALPSDAAAQLQYGASIRPHRAAMTAESAEFGG